MSGPFDDLARPPLDGRTLGHALVTGQNLYRDVEVVAVTGSTNADLVVRARGGAEPGLVLVAEHQRAGRGRLGRAWESPPRAALTFSVLLRPDVGPRRWPWLPLLAGVALADTLTRVAQVEASLKWPNDVLVAGGKVAGVLVERVDAQGGPMAVVGTGLNVTNTPAELPGPGASSLVLQGAATTDRSVLFRAICRTFGSLFTAWNDAQGAGSTARGLAEAYRSRCSTLGSDVVVSLPGRERVDGRAVGVDDDGRLVVATAQGQRVLGAGDVTHVRRG